MNIKLKPRDGPLAVLSDIDPLAIGRGQPLHSFPRVGSHDGVPRDTHGNHAANKQQCGKTDPCKQKN
jgi:hypothetical protein